MLTHNEKTDLIRGIYRNPKQVDKVYNILTSMTYKSFAKLPPWDTAIYSPDDIENIMYTLLYSYREVLPEDPIKDPGLLTTILSRKFIEYMRSTGRGWRGKFYADVLLIPAGDFEVSELEGGSSNTTTDDIIFEDKASNDDFCSAVEKFDFDQFKKFVLSKSARITSRELILLEKIIFEDKKKVDVYKEAGFKSVNSLYTTINRLRPEFRRVMDMYF